MSGLRLATISLLLLVAPMVTGGPSYDQEETPWRDTPREGTMQVSRDLVEWHSPGESANITVRFDPEGLQMEYLVEPTDGQEGLQFTYLLESIVEFQDQDGDGRLGFGDPVLQQARFEDMSKTGLRMQDASGHAYLHYNDFSNGIRIRVDLMFPFNGSGLRPTESSITFAVEGFRFESDNQTRLAVTTRLLAPVDLREHAIVHDTPKYTGYLAWDNTTSGVTLQAYDGDITPQTLLVFSSPRGADMEEQLVLGALEPLEQETRNGLESLRISDWRLWAIGLLLAGLIVTVSLARRLSRES